MLEAGFQQDFPAEVAREVQVLNQGAPKYAGPAARDLRSLLWSSIDNDSSRDLDQVGYMDKLPDSTMRLLVGTADVDASVPKGSGTDQHAAVESTSVYTGVARFPMLPAELSTDLTSLLDAQDRLSIIIELHIADSGGVQAHDVYPAWLRNLAKLAYNSTGARLEGRAPLPPAVANVPGTEAQLRLQLDTSEKLRGFCHRHGALTFESVETTPVLQNGEVKDLAVSRRMVADDIIESFMVAANVAMALNLREKGSPSIQRVVRTPKRWDRIQAIASQSGVKLPATPDPRALAGVASHWTVDSRFQAGAYRTITERRVSSSKGLQMMESTPPRGHSEH